jgi:NitT/TauT family transport system substrate-binding protein
LALALLLAAPAAAQDKVKVGMFPVTSALPYFVALERGYFKEQNIEPELIRLIGGPANIAAMISNQIDVSAVLVTIEGMNANLKKPGVAMFFSLAGQNPQYQMEQFVVRSGHKAESLKDLKGAKLMSAPGPANLAMARAVLRAVGLKEGDYTLDQLDMSHHVNAMKAGTFDGGYTLEPNASVMRHLGVARTLEAGVVARYVLGDPKQYAFSAGGAFTSHFIETRPDAARRFYLAWAKGVRFINENRDAARNHLVKNTFTPPEVAPSVPLHHHFVVGALTPELKQQFQKYVDFFVEDGTLPEKVEVSKYIKSF